ncbi:MAG: WYL domain-containing protein [Bacteroidales bacterium]|nr:WYL domain-containing protein [Bacteroidales bacterium]
MAKNYFDRYVWLIDIINRHGYIPFEDIDRAWIYSHLNKEGGKLPQRTFFNHIDAIFDTFGIEIKCDRMRGYYIANNEDLEENGIRQWLLESLSINNLLTESRDMRDRILFEKIPSSQRWLSIIVNSMREGTAVEFTYQSFWKDEPSSFEAHPWCLKLFKQRWYILAKSEGHKEPRIYALDERMLNVVPLNKKLRVPSKFSAEEFFSNYFGIIVGNDCKPSTVQIKVIADQVKYFESLPLHPSQKKIETTSDYSVFQYRLVPTFDFKQEILSRGPKVKVLAPDWFRDEVAEDIRQMANLYD